MVSAIDIQTGDTTVSLDQKASGVLLQKKKQSVLEAKLLNAVLADLPTEVSRLLHVGANAKWCDGDGVTLLHLVSSAKVAKMLIAAGADVNAKDKYNCSPLHFAKDEAIMRVFLLQPGVDMNVVDDMGQSPIFFADAKCTRLLLNNGANPNLTDNLGKKPLHYASAAQTRILLKAGVDVNARDNEGRTAMFGASPAKAKQLMSKGGQTCVSDNRGFTPLHTAESFEEAEFFLKHGTNVNVINIFNEPALVYARDEDHMELLFDRGARVDIVMKNKLSVLDLPHVKWAYNQLNGIENEQDEPLELNKKHQIMSMFGRVRNASLAR